MNKRSISMLLAFVVITLALSITTMADYATASSSGASASVTSTLEADLFARARISSLLYSVNDSDSGTNEASASVSASDLSRVDLYPPTSSYATAWRDGEEVAYDTWGN